MKLPTITALLSLLLLSEANASRSLKLTTLHSGRRLRGNQVGKGNKKEGGKGNKKEVEEDSTENLLACLSDKVENEPLTVISSFELVTCTTDVVNFIPDLLGFGQEENDTEKLESLLTCMGQAMECSDVSGEKEPEAEPEGEEEDDPDGDLFDCISNTIRGEPEAMLPGFDFDFFDCIGSGSENADEDSGPLQSLLDCIGLSIGCEQEEEDTLPEGEEGEDRFDGPGIETIPFLPLPEGEVGGDIRPIPVPGTGITLGQVYDQQQP